MSEHRQFIIENGPRHTDSWFKIMNLLNVGLYPFDSRPKAMCTCVTTSKLPGFNHSCC